MVEWEESSLNNQVDWGASGRDGECRRRMKKRWRVLIWIHRHEWLGHSQVPRRQVATKTWGEVYLVGLDVVIIIFIDVAKIARRENYSEKRYSGRTLRNVSLK